MKFYTLEDRINILFNQCYNTNYNINYFSFIYNSLDNELFLINDCITNNFYNNDSLTSYESILFTNRSLKSPLPPIITTIPSTIPYVISTSNIEISTTIKEIPSTIPYVISTSNTEISTTIETIPSTIPYNMSSSNIDISTIIKTIPSTIRYTTLSTWNKCMTEISIENLNISTSNIALPITTFPTFSTNIIFNNLKNESKSSDELIIEEREKEIKKDFIGGKNDLINNLTELINEIIIGQKYKITGDDFILEIRPTNASFLENTTHINFSKCETILRDEFNISSSRITISLYCYY